MNSQAVLDLTENLLKKAGAQSYDLICGYSDSSGLSVYSGAVQNTEISNSCGLGIRAFKNNCPGYAFTERFTPASIEQTVADALEHTTLTGELKLELPLPEPSVKPSFRTASDEVKNLSMEQMKEFTLELEARANAKDARIVNIPYLGMEKSSSHTDFRNSNGVCFSESRNSYSVGLGVVAKSGELTKMGIYSRGGWDLSTLSSEQMASIAAERAVELLNPSPIQSGVFAVMLSRRVSAQLLSMFASVFVADNVQKGQSRLKGKLGEIIASPVFNLLCDPHVYDLPGSTVYDGEGVLAQKLEVVADGNLQHYLYNLESAARDGMRSSGNATRSYSGKAGTGFSNFIVPLGRTSEQSLLDAYPKCLKIVKLEGASGCSAVSGEISIGAQGFLYENGVLQHGVEGITLSTNFFDLLKNIQGVGDTYNDTFSSYKVPDLLIDGVSVSG
jgi:PmbA protein